MLILRFFVAILCLASLGCAARKRNASWDKHNGYATIVASELRPDAKPIDCSAVKNWYEKYKCDTDAATPDAAKLARNRNDILDGFIQLADIDYSNFEDAYNKERSLIATLGDFTTLALTGAGSVFDAAKELSAAATGVQGAQHSYEKNYNDAQTRFVITLKMQALRKDILTRIKAGELLPAICPAPAAPSGSDHHTAQCYTLQEGMNDVGDYFAAGTVHRALADINKSSAAESQAADQKLKDLKGIAPMLKAPSTQPDNPPAQPGTTQPPAAPPQPAATPPHPPL